MKKKKPKILNIEDSKPTKFHVDAIVENISDEYGAGKLSIKTLILADLGQTKAVEQIPLEVQRRDIVCFDYGGFYSIFGSSGFIDWWNRFFIKLIEDYPNKDWRCYNALDVFDIDERKKLENLGVKFQW